MRATRAEHSTTWGCSPPYEVFSTDQVVETASRLQSEGLDTEMEESNLCCHAVQDKMWVTGPDSQRWEVYTVVDDEPEELLQISAKPAS